MSLSRIAGAVVTPLLVLALLAGCASEPVERSCPSGACASPPVTCAPGTADDGSGGCRPPGWHDCPSGFTTWPNGFGCAPILPQQRCDPGTMPIIGQPRCAPAGWRACPAGFTPHADGWGCTAVPLPNGCREPSMRVALGEARCVPVSDCGAPFPPPEARLFVSAAYNDAELDAAHFRSLEAALDAADQ
ncbi:MAG: hypothetical protein ACK4N5_23700, partial [Myxococcales bacterium]